MRSILFLLLLCVKGVAQQFPDYVVYLVKGNVTVKKNGASVPLKQNMFLYANESITVNKGAEITLSDKDGKAFVLNVPQVYSVSSLSHRPAKELDNLTQKYLHLLYHELLDPSEDFNKFKKQNIGGVWGGVSRSGECGNLLFPVQGLRTAELKLPFKWRKTNSNNHYSLKVYDASAKELGSIAVGDTATTLDLTTLTLGKTGKYFWRIQSDGGECEDETPLSFEIISQDEEKRHESLQKIDSSVANRLAWINQLEKDCLILSAKKQLAFLLSTNNDPALAKTYSWFLLKYHFDDEAQKAWGK